jgi:choline kinase
MFTTAGPNWPKSVSAHGLLNAASAMNALILTAGCSRRLGSLTDRTPKCLLPVGGVSILLRSVGHLVGMGFDRLVVVTGYLGHRVRDALGTAFPDLHIEFIDNPDYATTNNAYSLLAARPALDDTAFFLLDGDIVYDVPVVRNMLDHGPDCLALRTRGSIGMEEVKVHADARGRVLRIGKEVPVPSAAGESVGIQYFSREASSRLFATLHRRVVEHGAVNEYYEAAFQEMIDNGVVLDALDIGDNYAIEIDTREDLAAANRTLLARKSLTNAAAG